MAEPGVALVILAVEDRARAASFYREAFGWPIVVDTPWYAELAIPGGLRLGIYDRRRYGTNFGHEPRPLEGVTGTELYLCVDDLDAASARVQRAGGQLLDAPRPRDWGDIVVYFADPDGNVIALARRPSA